MKILTDREDMNAQLNNLGYDVFDIDEFCQEYFQNGLTYKTNLENFKTMYKEEQNKKNVAEHKRYKR